MAIKSKRSRLAPQRDLKKTFLYWTLAFILFKLILIYKIPAHAWLGADGENYIKAYEALIRDGLFSREENLHYWPAGYPIFLWMVYGFGKSWIFPIVSIIQSLVFAYSVYFFSTQIAKTKLKKISYLIFIFLSINPTLSLASICVGYESLAASGILLFLGLVINDLVSPSNKKFLRNLILCAISISVISFMQPRLLLSGIVCFIIWIFHRKLLSPAILLSIIAISVSTLLPSVLVLRNFVANDFVAVSTNLGTTMSLGAGAQATGYYNPYGEFGVPCNKIKGNAAEIDSNLVLCVMNWYFDNPVKAAELFLNKSILFWSPWSGHLGQTGSMLRNPWLKINPISKIASSSQEGNRLVFGPLGATISWIWIIIYIFLLSIGFRFLWMAGGIEKFISILALSFIAINMLISLGTLGDHRQRLPILGLSIFLQAIGIKAIFKGKGSVLVDGPALPLKVKAATNLN